MVKEESSTDVDQTSKSVSKPMFPSALHRIFNPPKLERKHSSGDLHSRLKTRKILGVGETDNGDIHRSKISQLLGHNEHLYVKFPRGFRIWHLILAVFITLQGISALVSPRYFHCLLLEEMSIGPDAIFAIRLSGATLLGMAIFVWSLQGTNEKAQARISLAAIVTHTLLQTIVHVMWLWQQSSVSNAVVSCLVFRAIIVVVSFIYYHAIGSSMAGLRKSASYKDLVMADVKKETCCPAPPPPPTQKESTPVDKKDE